MPGWKKTFVAAFAAQILSVIGFSFVMPFLPFFIADLGITGTGQQAWWAGVVMSAAGVTLGIFAPIWGVLADRYGRKAMVVRSMLGGTVVLFLMSLVQSVGQLVVCRLLQGAFTGVIAASVALVASVTPQRRSGFALGMMQAAVFLGLSLGPLVGGLVADHFGYRVTFRVGALIVLTGSAFVFFGTDENFTPPDPEARTTRMSYLSILSASGFMAAVAVLFSVRLSNSIANPSFPLIVKDILAYDRSVNSVTGMIIAAAALGGALSAALLGHFGDSWGHRRILVWCSIAAAAASLGHAVVNSIAALFVVRILFGISVAAMMPAANAIIQAVTDRDHIGKAYGAATALSMAGIAAGPFLGGTIANAFGLRAPFIVTAVGQVLIVLLVMAVLPASAGMAVMPRKET